MHHSIFVTVAWAIVVMVGICQAVEPIAAPLAFDMVKLLDAATHHPRLFLTERRLTDLRVKISTTHASMWKAVRAQADALVKSGPAALSTGRRLGTTLATPGRQRPADPFDHVPVNAGSHLSRRGQKMGGRFVRVPNVGPG